MPENPSAVSILLKLAPGHLMLAINLHPPQRSGISSTPPHLNDVESSDTTSTFENFELPKSVVMKIAKSSIPDNAKLQKETVLSLVKGSTVLINYLAAHALEMIGFSDEVNKLQGDLQIYRDLSKNDKSKKGTSIGASSSSRKAPTGSASASASAPPKGKDKEKASTGNPLPPVDWERDGPSDEELVEEESEDTVALEDEEMKRDALGVEDRANMVDDDD